MAAKHWELKHPGAKVARQSEARAPPRAAARRRGGGARACHGEGNRRLRRAGRGGAGQAELVRGAGLDVAKFEKAASRKRLARQESAKTAAGASLARVPDGTIEANIADFMSEVCPAASSQQIRLRLLMPEADSKEGEVGPSAHFGILNAGVLELSSHTFP